MGIDCRDGVCIHAQHADAGQQILQLLLDPLRAAADLAQMPAADGTARRHRLAVVAADGTSAVRSHCDTSAERCSPDIGDLAAFDTAASGSLPRRLRYRMDSAAAAGFFPAQGQQRVLIDRVALRSSSSCRR